jgi:hypothetical protein
MYRISAVYLLNLGGMFIKMVYGRDSGVLCYQCHKHTGPSPAYSDIKRRVILRASALFLNEYPFDHKYRVIEYNGLLAIHGHESAVYNGVISHRGAS